MKRIFFLLCLVIAHTLAASEVAGPSGTGKRKSEETFRAPLPLKRPKTVSLTRETVTNKFLQALDAPEESANRLKQLFDILKIPTAPGLLSVENHLTAAKELNRLVLSHHQLSFAVEAGMIAHKQYGIALLRKEYGDTVLTSASVALAIQHFNWEQTCRHVKQNTLPKALP